MNTTTNTRGVSEAMVALDRALEAVSAPLITDKANERAAWEAVSVLQSHGATLRAALSAPEPAAQGEAAAEFYGYIDGEPTLRWIGAPRPVGTKLYTAPPAQPAERGPGIDIKAAVSRFLGWRLPDNFAPDAGISFDREYARRWSWPTGTNLLDAEQAEAMLRYVLDVPSAPAEAIYYCTHCALPNHAGADHGDCEEAAKSRAMLAASPAPSPARVPEGMVLVPIPPANCRERLQREGKPYPRSGCAVCGKWAPKWRDCDVLLQAASITASPAPSEGGKGVDRYVQVPQSFVDLVRAAAREGTHPRAVQQLLDDAMEVLAATPAAPAEGAKGVEG